MDLAKIIAELRLELQCLDAAIASIEELARVQNVGGADLPPATASKPESAPPEPEPEGVAPVKRRRGRPRKQDAPDTGEPSKSMGPGSATSNGGDSTASAA